MGTAQRKIQVKEKEKGSGRFCYARVKRPAIAGAKICYACVKPQGRRCKDWGKKKEKFGKGAGCKGRGKN